MDILNQAKDLQERLVAWRRALHACPETGFDLPRTKALILQELTSLGYSPEEVGRGCIVARVGTAELAGSGSGAARVGSAEGAEVLLRADMDGLAIPEATKVEFRATNGKMHACGHDMHAAMLLGAAAILKAREGELSRGVRLLFQGAEETLQGAADAVAHGVCEGVGAAYMLHVTVNTGLPVGTVIVPPPGVIAPSADYFEITVRGKGCHGADPASGIDPLSAAARILLGLQHLPAREIPSGERGMLTVGMIHGGDAFNVIPEAARLGGSLRCYGEDFRQVLKTRTEQIARGVAEAFRTRAEVQFPAQCPSLVNDEGLRNRLCDALRGELGTDRLIVVDTPTGTAGSEDFAVISRTVPSVMLALAAGDPTVALHHPGIVFDEDALVYGTAALVTAAIR